MTPRQQNLREQLELPALQMPGAPGPAGLGFGVWGPGERLQGSEVEPVSRERTCSSASFVERSGKEKKTTWGS